MTLTRSGTTVVARTPGRRLSVLIRPRAATVGFLLAAAAVVLACVGIALGSRWIPLDDVLGGLLGTADRPVTLIVQQLRAPRVVVAILVGLALGLAGAIVQSVTRNPIAAPDVIGVTAGASFGAVAVLLAASGTTFGYGGVSAGIATFGVPLGAVAGALVAATIVLGVSGTRSAGGLAVPPQRVVLVGIVCHFAFIGLAHWGLAAGDADQATKAQTWLVGSLHARGWEHVSGVAMALALLLPVAVLLGPRLAALGLGESSAATLGIAVARTQLGLFLVAFTCTGIAAAAAGPINFIALLAPQIARRLARGPGIPLISSALTGAVLLLAADLLARFAVPGHELPAGAVTALIGAPFLLFLVVRMGARR